MKLLRRSNNFERLNSLLRRHDIYPWISGGLVRPEQLDTSTFPRSIILEARDGCFWFIDRGCGTWEAHTVFPPNAGNTYECALEAIQYIKDSPVYTKIVTMGPRDNPRAVRFLEKLKFRFTHTEGTFNGLPLDHYEYI